MTRSFRIPLPLRNLIRDSPVVAYAVSWTTLLTLTVAVASFSPELAFVSAISRSSSFSKACGEKDTIRVPVGEPGQVVCLPAQLFGRSKMDLLVPPLFAAVMVTGSACFVKAMALWEGNNGTS
ncbi:uncharacterized protein [Aristolochia californica]|uniref:uncharacterized protein n=1 Tax=Aristolochia californica TaxID=171875 RepID=UPI0035E2D7E6